MKNSNKKILFIVATHGDESFSIGVLKNIEKKFSKKKYGFDWVIGDRVDEEIKIAIELKLQVVIVSPLFENPIKTINRRLKC